ncbi:type II toxin-antitoxin system HicB family antitoxin [Quatrionicoccus australiensis]|uniref:type II toxin-antitoxin system HicB family antitoxin n=1 Tax=Quatrionicoccus australiensis TaxID=138118 RepID=UPI001CF9F3AD|nr:type II toxin-antitoxin system HicB family antitoxin [Quatrionicoccus australiensis]MCB4359214.1 type II toxin-antitoxin system HicB family antitoxin [Quatrionicoccus australiensis]
MNQPVPYKIKYEVYPEDGIFVARCLDIDVASDGDTEEEALANLREAIELFFERNAEAVFRASEEEDEDADAADDEEFGESDY